MEVRRNDALLADDGLLDLLAARGGCGTTSWPLSKLNGGALLLGKSGQDALADPDLVRSANPSTARIADVANEWGFWHMGQLAADYRRHFGERPSETLRRRPAS